MYLLKFKCIAQLFLLMKFRISLALLVFNIIFAVCAQETNKICSTPICVETGARILKNMDTTVDPCDNFYQFACGKYVKESKIPNDKPFVNIFAALVDDLNDKIAALMTSKQSNQHKVFYLLEKLYKQCMDEKEIEKQGLKSFVMMLKRFGDWPVREGTLWKQENFDWKDTVYGFRKMGINPDYFLSVTIETDSKNSTRRVISINQPQLGLLQEILVEGPENKIVRAYYDYMVKVAIELGVNDVFAKNDLKKSFEFELDIAKISLSFEKWWNATALYNSLTIAELQKIYPSIPWLKYITNVMCVSDLTITAEETVIVKVPVYLGHLEKLLSRTPKRTQANYLLWRAIDSSIPFLTKKLRNLRYEFEQVKIGNLQEKSRKQECLEDLSEKMDVALGALYVRNYFGKEARNLAGNIVDDLISAFKNMLTDLNWTDKQTTANALEKAKSMIKYVGYADEMLDDDKLEKYYKNLNLSFVTYILTSLELSNFLLHKHYKQLRDPVNKTEWVSRLSPLTINAVYSPTENSIQVPAGILQSIFFNKDRPQYLNYGAIGYVIGHEITHAFDDFGRHYDKNGNLYNWWTEYTQKAFKEKTQCFIDQYGKYRIPEVQLNLNGKNTINENIADNGGIKEAYLAYTSWTARNGPEPQLAGLNYTPIQMFWISAANVFCTNERPEYLKLSVLTNAHSPLPFRVLGPFTNSDQFANDFNCPKGSKMNPVQKCHIW